MSFAAVGVAVVVISAGVKALVTAIRLAASAREGVFLIVVVGFKGELDCT